MKEIKHPLRVAIIGVMFGLVVPSTIIFARADSINPNVYSIDNKPYGFTYAEWTAKWWQWSLSIPKDINPAGDTTGKNCAQNQNGSVWFLAGTFGGQAERSCTIPTGKAILFAPINAECSYAEYTNLKSEAELRTCAKTLQDQTTQIDVTIDGIKIQDMEKYRIQSPLFSVTFPNGNVYGIPAGTTQAVSDGNWVFLHPLSPGKHEIRSKGASIDFTTTATNTFLSDVTYHLMINP